jgi:hypothetical protein
MNNAETAGGESLGIGTSEHQTFRVRWGYGIVKPTSQQN